jgi:hypothetical protein
MAIKLFCIRFFIRRVMPSENVPACGSPMEAPPNPGRENAGMKIQKHLWTRAVLLAAALAFPGASRASSHREAPGIATMPKLDCTDFYMFNSYETGRSNYVTIIANYLPLQDAYGGPNYFTLDDATRGIYEIHIDNDGDAREDLTFQLKFTQVIKNLSLEIGSPADRRTNAVSLLNIGAISTTNTALLNVVETFQLTMITGNRRSGAQTILANAVTGTNVFIKPVDNIGNKSIADYDSYSQSFIYEIAIPGHANGRLFVGQRKDPFVVNLGETFDLVNYANPLGPIDGAKDSLRYKNVTAICLELPKSLLTGGHDPVIAGWTTASKVDAAAPGGYQQVSRLGNPLVNEVVIGLPDKDKFNGSEPSGDGQFAGYVTHPTFPAILEILFGGAGVKAPTLFPRADLVAVFLTGVDGVNHTAAIAEMLRLNTTTPVMEAGAQKALGVIEGDLAGYPNGRRPGDDIVDIALRVVMGKLLPAEVAPSGQLPFTDGAAVNATMFPSVFPYLNPPIPGSPNDPYITITPQYSGAVEGPYKNVTGSYNDSTGVVTVPKTGSSQGFYRFSSDTSGVRIKSVSESQGQVHLGLK